MASHEADAADGPADDACVLQLLVEAWLGAAIIGRGGGTVRRLTRESGVRSIHLSHHDAASERAQGGDRTVSISGGSACVKHAHRLIAQLLRTEADLPPDGRSSVRLLVPDAPALHGKGAISRLSSSGASVVASVLEMTPAQLRAGAGAYKQRLLTCEGSPAQLELAVGLHVDALAARHRRRHGAFLAQWPFETSYNDHFETPREAYAHILPLLAALARQLAGARGGARKRRRDEAAEGCHVAEGQLSSLRVYDPYYCQGATVELLSSLGLSRERVINAARDFYADIAERRVPAHDALVTNPPYSGEHKRRLLSYLIGARRDDATTQRAERGAPAAFLLLLPSWIAASDYWRDFLADLGELRRKGPSERAGRASAAERRAGVFYVAPSHKYAYAHAQATGHVASPFHSVWFCGGWPSEHARREAVAALRPARDAGELEVFRSAAMLQRRGHFTPASAAKQAAASSVTRHNY